MAKHAKPKPKPKAQAGKPRGIRRKLIAFDSETFGTLDLLAKDSMKTWEELADEAFRDLLRKHGRPIDLRDALKKSLKEPRPTVRPNRKSS